MIRRRLFHFSSVGAPLRACVLWGTRARSYAGTAEEDTKRLQKELHSLRRRLSDMQLAVNLSAALKTPVEFRVCVYGSEQPKFEVRQCGGDASSEWRALDAESLTRTSEVLAGEEAWLALLDSGREAYSTRLEQHITEVLQTPAPASTRKQTAVGGGALAVSPPATSSSKTVLDFSVLNDDLMQNATSAVEEKFPRLRLLVEHTTGADLQNTRTHTFSAHLVRRIPGSSLSKEEELALESFVGESVGTGFHSTRRRALRAAFAAVGMTLDSGTPLQNSASVLSLYESILSLQGLTPTVDLTESGVSITVRNGEREVISSLSGAPENALSLLLCVAEEAASKTDPVAAASAKNSIAKASLVIVLPDKGVRVKRILRRVLHYYYGVTEDDVLFRVTAPTAGQFQCDVCVRIPHQKSHNLPADTPSVVLGSAWSRTKKEAMQIAAVRVLHQHFPRLFADQLEYHAQVRSLMDALPAARPACPPLAYGLRNVLQWAVRQGRQRRLVGGVAEAGGTESSAAPAPVKVELRSRRLDPGTVHEPTGHAVTSCAWESVLTLSTNSDETAGEHETFEVVAVDVKKSKSEQKAIASAIAQKYRELCPDAFTYSVEQGLVGKDGLPTPCGALGTVQATGDADLRHYSACFTTDPIIRSLQATPIQRIPLPPGTDQESMSLLDHLRAFGRAHVAALAAQYTESGATTVPSDSEWKLTEQVQSDNEENVWNVKLVAQVIPGPQAQSPVDTAPAAATGPLPSVELSGGSHRCKPAALLRAYRELMAQVIGRAGTEKTQFTTIDSEEVQRHSESCCPAKLPTEAPLESVCVSLHRLYGVSLELRTHSYGRYTTIELWGVLSRKTAAGAGSEPAAPDAADHCWLGAGRGTTAPAAALDCAINVFAAQVAPLQAIFPGRQRHQYTCTLPIATESALGQLVSAVQSEITAASETDGEDARCRVDVRLEYKRGAESPARYSVSLVGVTPSRSVVLEKTVGGSLLGVLTQLCRMVAKETGAAPGIPELGGVTAATQQQQLQLLCTKTVGLKLSMETVHVQNEWNCRLSLPMEDPSTLLCLATYSASRKKEAVEGACQRALQELTPSHAPKGSQDGAPEPSSSTGAHSDTEESSHPPANESYVYCLQ